MCRWYPFHDRKERGTKKPLDEDGTEWKSWLKTQHWKNKNYGIHDGHPVLSLHGTV